MAEGGNIILIWAQTHLVTIYNYIVLYILIFKILYLGKQLQSCILFIQQIKFEQKWCHSSVTITGMVTKTKKYHFGSGTNFEIGGHQWAL